MKRLKKKLFNYLNFQAVCEFPNHKTGFQQYHGFQGTNLQYHGFQGTNLQYHGFQGINLQYHGFQSTNLQYHGFQGTNLQYKPLMYLNLRNLEYIAKNDNIFNIIDSGVSL